MKHFICAKKIYVIKTIFVSLIAQSVWWLGYGMFCRNTGVLFPVGGGGRNYSTRRCFQT